MTDIVTDQYTLHMGDCLEYMRGMADGSVDAVVTDPPFGTQDLADGYGRRQIHDKVNGKLGRMIQNDNDLSALQSAYPHFGRLMVEGWAAVFYAPRKTPLFIEATSRADWFGEIVWDKRQMGLGYHIRYQHESIAVFRFGEPPRPQDAISSVFCAHQLEKEHPHAKPVELMRYLIEWTSNVGDLIFDPFMGSGTTGVAAIQLGRRFLGCEIDEGYFEIARKRIEQAALQPRLFDTQDKHEPSPQQGSLL